LLGPVPNEPEAVTLLTQAATQGHPDAMAMLSILIDDNPVDWARKAVAGGSALGMVALAQFLADDDDDDKEEENARESRRLFQRAGLEMRKLQMSPQGQYYLGSLYENGLGFPVDYGEAFKAYKVSAEAGHALAQFSLGIMYADGRGVKKDEQKAVSWLRKAAEQGNDDGQFSLAVMYANGFGVEKDDLTAAMWYQKAAKQDHEEAQLALGVCYLQGEGVRADKVEATKWLQKAANKGNEEAKELLTRLGGRGRRRREQS
jgi:TPR repeat protein